MQTYYFTALHDERYAAIGEVQAESPEEAKAKIIERYHGRSCAAGTDCLACRRARRWTRLGAAWNHEDGEGMTLQLDLMPVVGGRIVLRAPKHGEEGAGTPATAGAAEKAMQAAGGAA